MHRAPLVSYLLLLYRANEKGREGRGGARFPNDVVVTGITWFMLERMKTVVSLPVEALVWLNFALVRKCDGDERRAKQGCTFGTQKGSHLKVYLGDRRTVIPMHPAKEMKSGTVRGIKKQLGLE